MVEEECATVLEEQCDTVNEEQCSTVTVPDCSTVQEEVRGGVQVMPAGVHGHQRRAVL